MLLEPREDCFFALAGLARAGRNSGSDRGKGLRRPSSERGWNHRLPALAS
jgi:hypothetical protein